MCRHRRTTWCMRLCWRPMSCYERGCRLHQHTYNYSYKQKTRKRKHRLRTVCVGRCKQPCCQVGGYAQRRLRVADICCPCKERYQYTVFAIWIGARTLEGKFGTVARAVELCAKVGRVKILTQYRSSHVCAVTAFLVCVINQRLVVHNLPHSTHKKNTISELL